MSVEKMLDHGTDRDHAPGLPWYAVRALTEISITVWVVRAMGGEGTQGTEARIKPDVSSQAKFTLHLRPSDSWERFHIVEFVDPAVTDLPQVKKEVRMGPGIEIQRTM